MRMDVVKGATQVVSFLSLIALALLVSACAPPSSDPNAGSGVERPVDNDAYSYRVIYSAMAGGRLQGKPVQTISENTDASEVTAVASPGFLFDGWSDGVTSASRIDSAGEGDLSLQAHFKLDDNYAPWLITGHFGSLSVRSLNASGATIEWPDSFSGGSYSLYVTQDPATILSDYQTYGAIHWTDVMPGFELTELVYGQPTYVALANNGELVSWTSFTPGEPEPNEEIYAFAEAGDGTRYVGGDFTHFGFLSGSSFLTPVSGSDHPLAWPIIAGKQAHAAEVRSVISDGQGGWYMGGDFAWVGGQPSLGLTHIDSSGQVSDWVTDALSAFDFFRVSALAIGANGEVYVAGIFREVTEQESRTHYLIALDSALGELLDWRPLINREVNALAFQDGLLYAGGEFTRVDGRERGRLAAFDTENKLLLDWRSDVDGAVQALLVYDNKIFVGGDFYRSSNELIRSYLTAFDQTGQALDWPEGGAVRGQVGTTVRSLAVDRGVVYVGGENLIVAGEQRNLLAIDLDGEVLPWWPEVQGRVDALAARQGKVYVGGDVSGEDRRYLLAVDEDAELLSWSPRPDGPINALAIEHDTIAAAGISQVVHAKPRSHLAAFNADEELLDWRVEIYNTPSCINRLGKEAAPSGVRAMVLHEETLYIGGRFDRVQDAVRTNLAALALNGDLLNWDAEVSQTDFQPCYEYDPDYPDYHIDTYLEIGVVHSLTIDSGVIKVAGDFYEVNGEARDGEAEFEVNGALLAK